MSGGWTPIHDRMFDPEHELAGEPVCKRWAWAELVHMARKTDGNRIIKMTAIPLKRGEFVASVRFLADRFNWSRAMASRFLQMLQSEAINKLETVRETPHGTVYRIVSYDTYALTGDTNRDTKRDEGGTRAGRGRDKVVKGRSKEGKEKTREARKSTLPDEWEPHDKHRERAKELSVDVDGEADAFRDHHLAKGSKYVDWDRAFFTWLRNTQKWGANTRRTRPYKAPRYSGRFTYLTDLDESQRNGN